MNARIMTRYAVAAFVVWCVLDAGALLVTITHGLSHFLASI